MEISNYIQSGMLVIQLVVVILTAITLLATMKNFQKQFKLNFFADYTKRYQEIILNLPISIYEMDFNYNNLNEIEKDNFIRYMRIYFDLCSEEYHLWETGHIEQKVWREWKEGIKYSFLKPAFQQAWETIDKSHYTDFYNFIINDIQNGDQNE